MQQKYRDWCSLTSKSQSWTGKRGMGSGEKGSQCREMGERARCFCYSRSRQDQDRLARIRNQSFNWWQQKQISLSPWQVLVVAMRQSSSSQALLWFPLSSSHLARVRRMRAQSSLTWWSSRILLQEVAYISFRRAMFSQNQHLLVQIKEQMLYTRIFSDYYSVKYFPSAQKSSFKRIRQRENLRKSLRKLSYVRRKQILILEGTELQSFGNCISLAQRSSFSTFLGSYRWKQSLTLAIYILLSCLRRERSLLVVESRKERALLTNSLQVCSWLLQWAARICPGMVLIRQRRNLRCSCRLFMPSSKSRSFLMMWTSQRCISRFQWSMWSTQKGLLRLRTTCFASSLQQNPAQSPPPFIAFLLNLTTKLYSFPSNSLFPASTSATTKVEKYTNLALPSLSLCTSLRLRVKVAFATISGQLLRAYCARMVLQISNRGCLTSAKLNVSLSLLRNSVGMRRQKLPAFSHYSTILSRYCSLLARSQVFSYLLRSADPGVR